MAYLVVSCPLGRKTLACQFLVSLSKSFFLYANALVCNKNLLYIGVKEEQLWDSKQNNTK